jgi:hypothetical protein
MALAANRFNVNPSTGAGVPPRTSQAPTPGQGTGGAMGRAVGQQMAGTEQPAPAGEFQGNVSGAPAQPAPPATPPAYGSNPYDFMDPAAIWQLGQLNYQMQNANLDYGWSKGMADIQNRHGGENLGIGLRGLDLDRADWRTMLGAAQSNMPLREQQLTNLGRYYGVNEDILQNAIAKSLSGEGYQTANTRTDLARQGLTEGYETGRLNTNLEQSRLGQEVAAFDAKTRGERDIASRRSQAIAGGAMHFGGTGTALNERRELLDNNLRGINEGAELDRSLINQQLDYLVQSGVLDREELNRRLAYLQESGVLERHGLRLGADKERIGLDNQVLGARMSLNDARASLENLTRQGERFAVGEDALRAGYRQAVETRDAELQRAYNQLLALRGSADESLRQIGEDLYGRLFG